MAPPTQGNSSVTPPNGWQQPREPRKFEGKPEEDVDEWLTHYERVSKYNRWNAADRLANVVFSLDKTALTWFENHEEKLTTWDGFVEEIRKAFGDSEAKKKKAEQTLLQRAQVPGETCTTYIEEILKLCRVVDARMPEDDRVGHILKGIAEDVFNFLISKDNLNTISDVIQHCRRFEALKMRRITPKFGRLPNVTTVASVDVNSSVDLASTIRQIVREELLRHSDVARPWTPSHNSDLRHEAPPRHVESLRPSVNVADFVDDRRGDMYTSPTRDRYYQSRGRFHRPQDAYHPDDYRRSSPSSRQFPSGRFDSPREPPVCYRCGVAGHISRFCRRRSPGSSAGPRFTWPRGSNYNPNRWSPPFPPTGNNQHLNGPRNGSPASDRSLTPPPLRQRQSPSPRRRPLSPPPGN
ncbi:uncharacterized protein LOC144180728 [Haemaphysalis longicornis]